MQTIFNPQTVDSITTRIEKIDATTPSKWGKMTAYQMVKHCIMSEDMYLGNTSYKRAFIGKLFGKMALKGMLKNDAPIKQNQPTHPLFKITGDGNTESEKSKWIDLVKQYAKKDDSSFSSFEHPFFGKMTKDQLGIAAYKHINHHLDQFGV